MRLVRVVLDQMAVAELEVKILIVLPLDWQIPVAVVVVLHRGLGFLEEMGEAEL